MKQESIKKMEKFFIWDSLHQSTLISLNFQRLLSSRSPENGQSPQQEENESMIKEKKISFGAEIHSISWTLQNQHI